ncbi:MAG: MFS transporter, partial [Collinsella sp.]|nr:MFS transporter [Collinsella sp.]
YKQKYGRERGPEDTIGHIVGGVFSEVVHTMREIAHNKTVLVYMIAFFFYIDGVHTVISMATSYGSALGIDSTQLVLALLVTQFVAFPSAIIYGKLAGRVGTLNMILVAVAAYMGIVLFAAFFLKTAFEFWVLAIMVGLFQGGVQALSRSYFGRIIPKEKSNEYYGFFDIFGRYASVMGTFLVSVVTSLTGNPSLGVLSIAVLLVVGFMLLARLSRMTRAAEHAA